MGELIFYSKIKSFQCFQCLAAVPSHVEGLGNLKNKYKIKKVKVRNQTIHNKVQQKQNMRGRRTEPTEKKKKKKKGEGDGQTNREEEEKKRGRRRNRQRRRRKKGKKKKKQKKKKKLLLHGATPASSSSSSFSPSSLFSFLTNDVSTRYPFTGRNNRILSVQSVRDRYDQYFFRYEIRGLSVPAH